MALATHNRHPRAARARVRQPDVSRVWGQIAAPNNSLPRWDGSDRTTVFVRPLAPAGPRFDGDPSSPWLSHAPIASRLSLTRAKIRRMKVADNWRTGHGRHAREFSARRAEP